MTYAVVSIAGKQYKVKKDDLLAVDRLGSQEGDKLKVDDVLLLVNDGKVLIGKPKVLGAQVVFKVQKQFKGKKILVEKFKAKSRYHRQTGHRQLLTQLQVLEILSPK